MQKQGERLTKRLSSLAIRWRRLPTLARAAILLAPLLALPLSLNNYQIAVLALVGLYALLGIGLNIVVGFAGLLDLGFVAFFAIGAYLYGLAASPHFGAHVSFWIMLPVAMAVAGFAGVVLGLPVLRMRGDYLAIVTLGFGEIVRLLLNNLDPITRGPQGILSIASPVFLDLQVSLPGLIEFVPPTLFDIPINLRTKPVYYYYLALAACLLAVVLASRLKDSRVGRAWEALREDEDAAEAMGIDPVRYKLLAFAIGASFGGLGGVIFAAAQGAIFPADFSLMVSINVLCLVIIGGMGSVPGVVLGALVLMGLPELLRFAFLPEYRMLVFGALLVVVMALRPQGFLPAARRQVELAPPSASPGTAGAALPTARG